METWVIISIVVLVILIVFAIIATVVVQQRNTKLQATNLLIPFGGFFSTDSANPSTLTRADGSPQIACPVGSNINIVSAWSEVYDPFLQCTAKPILGNPSNDTCQPTNTLYNCKIRNATPFLAAECNGQNTCNVTIDTTTFGPYPCNITPGSAEYSTLPDIPGNPGYSGTGTPIPATTGQGYIVTGLYTCQLQDEPDE